MADKYINVLPQATYISDSDLFLLEQGGTSKKLLGSLLREYIDRNIVTITVNTVASTEPAEVVSYDQVTGALELNLPKGIGISDVEFSSSAADPSYGNRVKRIYNIILDDDTEFPFAIYDGKDGQGTVNSVNGILPDQYNDVTLIFEVTVSISAASTTAQIGSLTNKNITAKTKLLRYEIADPLNQTSQWTVTTSDYTDSNTPNLTINGMCSANTTAKLILAEVV